MPSGWAGTTTARSFAIKQDPAPGLLGKPSSMQGRGCTGRSRSRADGQLASELAATTTSRTEERVPSTHSAVTVGFVDLGPLLNKTSARSHNRRRCRSWLRDLRGRSPEDVFPVEKRRREPSLSNELSQHPWLFLNNEYVDEQGDRHSPDKADPRYYEMLSRPCPLGNGFWSTSIEP